MEAFEDQEETYFNNDEDVEKERENVHQYFAQGGSDRVVAVKQIHKVYGTKMKKYVYYTYDDPKKAYNFFPFVHFQDALKRPTLRLKWLCKMCPSVWPKAKFSDCLVKVMTLFSKCTFSR